MKPPISLPHLAAKIDEMDPGDRLIVLAGYTALWPRPPAHEADDYLSDKERAKRWCDRRGCNIWERMDPPGLYIEKRRHPSPNHEG